MANGEKVRQIKGGRTGEPGLSSDATPPTNLRYHHGNLRQALIDAALLHLKTHGHVDLSLRDLAKATRVSPNAPYRHFPSKNALVATLGAYGFAQLSNQIDDIVEDGPIKQFRALGQAFVTFAIENSALFRLMFGFRFDVEQAAPELHQARERCFNQVVESVRIVMHEVLVTPDVKKKSAVAWSLFCGHGLLASDRTYPLSILPDELEGKDIARVLARGLKD